MKGALAGTEGISKTFSKDT